MTLNELKNDVAKLGFESYIEDEDCFIASANRALSLIYVDRPVSKTALISFRGPRPTLVREHIEHRSGEVISISFKGKAISFRTSGNGTCVIKDDTGSSETVLSADGQLVKRLIFGNGTVTFSGPYYFTVRNLAVYEDRIGDKVTDIPEYSAFKELRPEDYCDDFRAFSSQPYTKDGKPIDELKLVDGKIIAPYDYAGEFYLTYYKSPRPISKDLPNGTIEISKECEVMLPLLTASFMWLDDDAAKAQYYMSLYRDIAANVKRYSTNKIDTVYRVNGWA